MIAVAVYTIAAAVAATTLFGAIRLLDRRQRRAIDGTEADAPVSGSDAPDPRTGAPASRADASTPSLAVLARKRVGVGRTLVVVDVEGRRLLLGSTKGAWTALADLGRAAPTPQGPEAADAIEAELNRALNASRFRRGGRPR